MGHENKIIDPSPYQHRKYFDEDRLRELGVSIVKDGLIEPIIIRDEEMGKDPWYLTVGKTPLERVHNLLSKLDSIRVCNDRGSLVSKVADDQFHKYVELVESIFKNLPKPLKWRSFLTHDLILLTDIPSIVQIASVKHDLMLIASLSGLKFSDYFELIKNFPIYLYKKKWSLCSHDWVF